MNTTSVLGLVLLSLIPLSGSTDDGFNPFRDTPESVPLIDPSGVKLQTRRLADGVYALDSDEDPVDNSGFVVGDRGVLVIDAHVNETMARQIQRAVAQVTKRPILYLINTNFHGDHTFGNAFFPSTTTIVAHKATAARMQSFEGELDFLRKYTVGGNTAVFDGARFRGPDLTFDDYLQIDLGGRIVELFHFGPGNTPGDTVVWVPDARVAWTGNLVNGEGTIPPIFEGGTEQYLSTVASFAATLQPRVIVPGHGALTGGAQLGRYLDYLSGLLGTVRAAIANHKSIEQTVASHPLGADWIPADGTPGAPLADWMRGLHELNVRTTYHDQSRSMRSQ